MGNEIHLDCTSIKLNISSSLPQTSLFKFLSCVTQGNENLEIDVTASCKSFNAVFT